MMKNCLDTGTIQAFLDGELAPAAASGVSAHIAACDACAAQLATAEEESAFVFSVLAREMDTLVPTQRLWNKINDSIEVERHNAPLWQKAWAIISVALSNPSIAVAAAILVVVGLFTVVLIDRNQPANTDVVARRPETTGFTSTTSINAGSQDNNVGGTSTPVNPSKSAPIVEKTIYRPEPDKDRIDTRKRVASVATYIPGEESYVKTIATMSQSVDNKKGSVLRPSERVSYERDMAVVDDAIAKMKEEVRKNPKNESAKQVLYSSYQNKIDLLNSVSQREELVASLKD